MQNNRVIVVVQAGWVFVGTRVPPTQPSDDVLYTDAATIRRWGSTNGLGELAMRGATNTTELDPCGMVRIKQHAILFEISVTSDL